MNNVQKKTYYPNPQDMTADINNISKFRDIIRFIAALERFGYPKGFSEENKMQYDYRYHIPILINQFGEIAFEDPTAETGTPVRQYYRLHSGTVGFLTDFIEYYRNALLTIDERQEVEQIMKIKVVDETYLCHDTLDELTKQYSDPALLYAPVDLHEIIIPFASTSEPNKAEHFLFNINGNMTYHIRCRKIQPDVTDLVQGAEEDGYHHVLMIRKNWRALPCDIPNYSKKA